MKTRPLLRRLVHYLVYAAAGMVIVASLLALALRLFIMPNIEGYKADVERMTTRALDIPVRIGGIEADWWNINPRLRLLDLELHPKDQAVPLRLPRVDTTLSWFSLLVGEVRLARLNLVQPRLTIQRDTEGVIRVAGIVVNKGGGQSPFPDWLLRQHDVTVSNGELVWQDDLLHAPPLTLRAVNLHLTNLLGRHRFGLTATPPAQTIDRLDVRGELKGDTVHVPEGWSGQLYLRADGASSEALQHWAPWAQKQVRQGRGDARLWAELVAGKVVNVTSDVRLEEVAVSLAADLPDMRFRQISGRLAWRHADNEHRLQVENLRFATEEGDLVEPASLKINLLPGPDGGFERVIVNAQRLRLEALTAVSNAIPLPHWLRTLLGELNPRGMVESADVAWLGRERFSLKTRFQEVGINQTETQPGFSGLNGEVEADDRHGRVSLNSDDFNFVFDKIMRHPIHLDRFQSKLAWSGNGGRGLNLEIGQTHLGNEDLDASASGSVSLKPGESPQLDIRAHLTRGNATAVWKYLPQSVGDGAYNWLKAGLVSGHSRDTRLVLRGPTNRFPYVDGGGEFSVAIKAEDASLHYAPGWPEISGINGWVVFRGLGLNITASEGKALGVKMGPVRADVPDLKAGENEVLTISGLARGNTQDFFAFIRQSPIFDHTGRFTEHMEAGGEGVLQLKLALPLHHIADSQVSGEYKVANNWLKPDKDLPRLEEVQGAITFTRNTLQGRGIRARLLGQPALLNLSSEAGGHLKAALEGRWSAGAFAQWVPATLLRQFSGSADFRAEVALQPGHSGLTLSSDLEGIALKLPAPFNKPAQQARALSINIPAEVDPGVPGRRIDLRYGQSGQQVAARVVLRGERDTRVGVRVGGGDPVLPEANGIALRGNLPTLDLDAWQKWLGSSENNAPASEDGAGDLPVRDVQVSVGDLKVFDRHLHALTLQAKPLSSGWRAQVSSREIQGDIIYDQPPGLPGKRFIGQFQRFEIPAGAFDAQASDDLPTRDAGTSAPYEMPRIVEVNAQSFRYGERDLGALAATLESENTGLRLKSLGLNAPDGRFTATGWISASHRRPTELDIQLEANDLGKLLKRLDYSDGIKGGKARVTGKLSWMGRPEDFVLKGLNGSLDVNLQNGRFSKLDPGAGKLLGVLSLQALPRRIALDFRDVFSEGFAFDAINGHVHIERGTAYLPGLQVNGPAASVNMNGKVDMVGETQNLRLRVQPRLDEGVALASALIGGPVVGVGALVASKILKDPIAKVASFEYLVTGNWAEPNVAKMAKTQAAIENIP